jgi:hypothetical protein
LNLQGVSLRVELACSFFESWTCMQFHWELNENFIKDNIVMFNGGWVMAKKMAKKTKYIIVSHGINSTLNKFFAIKNKCLLQLF